MSTLTKTSPSIQNQTKSPMPQNGSSTAGSSSTPSSPWLSTRPILLIPATTYQHWWPTVYYSLSLKAIGVHQLRVLRRVGQRYGFFDGDKHPRDGVPDVGVRKTAHSLLSVIAFRPMIATVLAYRSDERPSSINWLSLPLEIAMYAIVLDFWYYWYHRVMHENLTLWQFHRTHHLTSYADSVQ